MSRPFLPWKHQNTKIKDRTSLTQKKELNCPVLIENPSVQSKDLPPVKYQLLDRDGQQVLVSLTHAMDLNPADYEVTYRLAE